MFLSYTGTSRKTILPRLNNSLCCRTIANCLASRYPSTDRPRLSNLGILDGSFIRNRVSNGKTVPVSTKGTNSRSYHDVFDKMWGWWGTHTLRARRRDDQVPTSLDSSSHKNAVTLDIPHKIQSNLDLETEEQTAKLARSRLPVKEWGLYVDPNIQSSSKVYAIIGHVPGIYCDWKYARTEQTKSFGNSMSKKCRTVDEAWRWLEKMRVLVDEALDRPRGRAYLASVGKASLCFPSSKLGSNMAQQKSIASVSQSRHHTAQHPSSSLSRSSSESPGAWFLDQAVPPKNRQGLPWTSQLSTYNGSLADPKVVLSSEQERVVEQIMKGRNVFYTGSAGCGKSAVLRAFKKRLEEEGKQIVVIAPTGLAALNVGGITLHRYAGWRPQSDEDSLDRLISKTLSPLSNKGIAYQFRKTDVLVIDEISMIQNNTFERLDAVMRYARGIEEAFGGVQVVVTGDFCQLPPVSPFQHCVQCGGKLTPDTQWDPSSYQCRNKECGETEFLDTDKWAFRSNAWKGCDFEHIHLTEVHRQFDPEFKSILQAIRSNGTATGQAAKILRNHHSETDGAIEIFPRRVDVAAVNQREIALLPMPAKSYACLDNFHLARHHRNDAYLKSLKNHDPLIDGHRYETRLELKLDMRVLLLHNLAPEVGLVNGSQGKIIGFERYDREVILEKPNIHGLYGMNQILAFAEGAENMCQDWPIVMFDNGQWRTIYADCMATEYGFGEPKSLLSRTQIPLAAGYAMTVHKAQGMTLDRVKADLRRAFVPGMVYVALSRARSLSGLECQLPTRPMGGPNREVREFLDSF